jgi:hypothetical protein
MQDEAPAASLRDGQALHLQVPCRTHDIVQREELPPVGAPATLISQGSATTMNTIFTGHQNVKSS